MNIDIDGVMFSLVIFLGLIAFFLVAMVVQSIVERPGPRFQQRDWIAEQKRVVLRNAERQRWGAR
jgi:hypothetical protein